MKRNIILTDGPQAGKRPVLEPWQKQILKAIDSGKYSVIALQLAAQTGKTLLALACAVRSAVDGSGALMASATSHSVLDLRRRLDRIVADSEPLQEHFQQGPLSGPGARSAWNNRSTAGGGFLALAKSGSAAELSSRTIKIAICDEVSRWPRKTLSGEGSPYQLVEARVADWEGRGGCIIAISSPVRDGDQINVLFRDGDRNECTYRCPSCNDRTRLLWENVVGRGQGEEPMIACARCGELFNEKSRRKMLATQRWEPQRKNPTDELTASYHLSRLDSRRSSLGQVCRSWRAAKMRGERGDPLAVDSWRNLVLGLPSQQSALDIDALYEKREETFDTSQWEQLCTGVDVQDDRLEVVTCAFSASDVWVIDVSTLRGDPREAAVWESLDAHTRQRFGGLGISVTSIDAGFLTSSVRRECAKRRWWLPVIGRATDGTPIASRPKSSGLCTCGKTDSASWWTGKVGAGRVHFLRAPSGPGSGSGSSSPVSPWWPKAAD